MLQLPNCLLHPRNLSVPELYEKALLYEHDTHLMASGALATTSGEKTGTPSHRLRVVVRRGTGSVMRQAVHLTGSSELSFKGTHILITRVCSPMNSGRSPRDKRVVKEPGSEKDVWWGDGSPNMPMVS